MNKNKKNIPGNATPAPAKAEKKNTSVNHIARSRRKEIEARKRARRIRSLMKQGLSKEEIGQWFKKEENRLVLVLVYNSFCIKDGEKKLCGVKALEKFCNDNKLTLISSHKGSVSAGWILSDKDGVEKVIELLKPVGRTSITKPENPVSKPVKEPKEKKPSNNTIEVKKAAKTRRKELAKKGAEMRPYYAALRKGGINARIKKHNPTLAKKIEKWLKEKKAAEASRTKGTKEERAKHRQLTSLEMKANKRARKAVKHLAAKERRMAAEKKRAESNAKQRAERTQKAQKPVQTELKAA